MIAPVHNIYGFYHLYMQEEQKFWLALHLMSC
jgi:hypothetical protein